MSPSQIYLRSYPSSPSDISYADVVRYVADLGRSKKGICMREVVACLLLTRLWLVDAQDKSAPQEPTPTDAAETVTVLRQEAAQQKSASDKGAVSSQPTEELPLDTHVHGGEPNAAKTELQATPQKPHTVVVVLTPPEV